MMSDPGNMNDTLVSAIIPSFNSAPFIATALDSVLAQTHPAHEVIVVDDGSTDDTAAVLRAYRDRVRVIEQENSGLSAARNAGIISARGGLIALLDADDWWLPTKIERQVDLLSASPNVGFCSTCARIVDVHGYFLNVWACPDAHGSMLHTIFARNASIAGGGSGVVVRRTLFAQAGLFDVHLKSLEDIDMWLRLAAICNYACINEALTVIRRRDASMSKNRRVMRDQALYVMRKNRDLLPLHDRGRFWRYAYAGVLVDYAKWEYRDGHILFSIVQLIHALALSPLRRARLVLGLLLAFLKKEPV